MNEYKTRCELHFTTTYTEGILNGTDPVLKDELVPITIEDNGTVKKADLESEWYSYANKEWANAVILEDQYDSLNTKGKVYGATKEDGYVSFDGVDDYIDLGLENYEFTNGLTFNINFSLNSIHSSSDNDILGNWHVGGGGIYVSSNGELVIEFYMNGSYERIFTGKILEVNQDYQVIAIISQEKMGVYLNKNLISERSINCEYVSSVMPIIIGANPEEVTNYGYADIDVKSVQIYNRAIAENEIVTVSNGKVMDDTGLLRYIDFTNKIYEDGEIIPESAIESYFVWIPKYRYQLWDLGLYDSLTSIDTSKVHEIPIIFGDYNTSDDKEGECTTPMESGATGNCQIGDYMTHPAFLSIPSTGFWVGKFETGYNGATSQTEAEQNVNDSSKIIVKPSTYSWRGIQVANAFYSSYNYKRNLDSHMMKNTEWGAVAYLQHSAYGSTTSVRINNNSNYITGYAANNKPTCGYTGTSEECNKYCNDGTCNTTYPNSILASTTGNITGIYDVSGGAWEYVMGVIVDQSGNPMSGRNSLYNSGFNGSFGCPTCDSDSSGLTELADGYEWPDKKYYDIYVYGVSATNYQRRILGDATGETGPFNNAIYINLSIQVSSWYENNASFALYTHPWLGVGGGFNRGINAGMFAFDFEFGRLTDYDTFRIILTPTGGTS